MSDLEAVIVGPPETPFEKGFFKIRVHLPDRYPFEPPQGCQPLLRLILAKLILKSQTHLCNRKLGFEGGSIAQRQRSRFSPSSPG